MELRKALLESYTAADEDQRLSMFLVHRDMRRHFIKIDMRAAAQPEIGRPKQAHVSNAGFFWGWLKHRCLVR